MSRIYARFTAVEGAAVAEVLAWSADQLEERAGDAHPETARLLEMAQVARKASARIGRAASR